MTEDLGSLRYERDFGRGLDGKYAAVLGHIPPGSRILELGGSSGYFTRALMAAGHTVTTFDIDPQCIERARRDGVDAHLVDLDQPLPVELLRGRAINVVLLMDVLEHLVDPARLLVRLRDALGPHFTLIVTGPNVAYWSVRLSLLGGRWRYADAGIMDRTHLRWFTLATWRELLEEAGYVVSVQGAAEGMIPKEQWLRRLGVGRRGVDRMRHLLLRRAPTLFGTVLMFVTRPAG